MFYFVEGRLDGWFLTPCSCWSTSSTHSSSVGQLEWHFFTCLLASYYQQSSSAMFYFIYDNGSITKEQIEMHEAFKTLYHSIDVPLAKACHNSEPQVMRRICCYPWQNHGENVSAWKGGKLGTIVQSTANFKSIKKQKKVFVSCMQESSSFFESFNLAEF